MVVLATDDYVAVVDPGTKVAEVDCFNQLVAFCPWKMKYYLPALFGTGPLVSQKCPPPRAIIILGSGASVNDSIPWQNDLREWLSGALDREIPTLGICYGHQLLASLFGSTVTFFQKDGVKLTGIREITMATNEVWPKKNYRLVVSHREVVSCLSSKLRLIASSPRIEAEAFSHQTKPFWGIQAHPEATAQFVKNQQMDKKVLSSLEHFRDGHEFMRSFFSYLNST